MRKGDLLANSLAWIVYLFLASLTSMVTSAFITFIINKIVGLEYPARAGMLAVSNAVIAGIILYILAFREGYRAAEYNHKTIILPLITATIVHFVTSIALSFTQVIAGGVRYAAGLMSLGGDFQADDGVKVIGYGALIASYLIHAVVYAAVINCAYYTGCKKRCADRAELTGGQSGEKPKG